MKRWEWFRIIDDNERCGGCFLKFVEHDLLFQCSKGVSQLILKGRSATRCSFYLLHLFVLECHGRTAHAKPIGPTVGGGVQLPNTKPSGSEDPKITSFQHHNYKFQKYSFARMSALFQRAYEISGTIAMYGI